jgi:S-(hydroxymethyl)glutathione dehydrogenase / alcohol dehydrogenase
MKMKAAVVRKAGGPINIEEVNLDPPKAGEILVKTKYCGYCHSDWSAVEDWLGFPMPIVIGHEASGVVVEVGSGVDRVKKGDHVCACWAVSCGKCKMCVSGRESICPTNREFIGGGTLLDGTSRLSDAEGNMIHHMTFVSGFAEYLVIPEAGAIVMPKEMPLEQACLMGCCMPTGYGAVFNTAKVKPGDSVAVWGMGGIGLNVTQGAYLRGANPIIAVDLEGSKEALAREFGATHFIDSSKEDPVPLIQEMTGGGVDFVFEATGDTGAIQQVYWAMGIGGKQIQIGIHNAAETIPMSLAFTPPHNRDIIGTLYGGIHVHKDIPAFADLIMSGRYADLDKLISRKFKLEDLNDVHKAMTDRKITGRWICEFD